jgi:hypothetical protein
LDSSVAKVGLKMNTSKTKYMSFNLQKSVNIKTTALIKYLGAWMQSSEKDIKTLKAAAWRAWNKMPVTKWKSLSLPT